MENSPRLDAVLRPVRAGNAFEETVERLLRAIKLGVVPPGDRLPAERELAVRLGISRVTLREAIKYLADAGYLQVRRGRYGGAFVIYREAGAEPADLRKAVADMGQGLADALDFRMAVECGAAQVLAAATLTTHQRDTLCRRLADVDGSGPDDYRRLDTAFHLSIAELTGSTLLAGACADARLRVAHLLNAIPILQTNIDHAAVQHRAIVTAILVGDPAAAYRAVAEHLEATAALLRGFLA
ncbi:GntR family transcriptional regulator [Spongiactinospora gelatinilytica]|uniref:GntR family transcriptional regulator n=1 Tax=Spongiactinospora gelatinilytica TaxID=2666298 RepID=A0A2W2ESM6_9ACTN|nr:FCD domain-containing protein [Spongiactinospora gelatinilytica]PZG25851.1 GntR family transcriptional regulator [Spongiactinospora gelatinilytica]